MVSTARSRIRENPTNSSEPNRSTRATLPCPFAAHRDPLFDGLIRGHVHHLKAPRVKSASGQAVWHPEAFYTLNEIPAE